VTLGGELREETRAFNEELRQLVSGMPPVEAAPPEATRRARYEGRGIFPAPVFVPEARWVEVPSRRGGLRVRVIPPLDAAAAGVYLHLHGGGWTLGAADLQDVLLSHLAQSIRIRRASRTARTRLRGCSTSARRSSGRRRTRSRSAASRPARTWRC
jgi:acetyl esterase